ncbi:MAG: hypothetical protein HYT27_01765 [Parcubacteria group bacterium]|nr:hypothetical protein [Parcubacteria group bacterium]
MDEAKYKEIFVLYRKKMTNIPNRKFPSCLLKPALDSALAHCNSMLDEMEVFLKEKRMDKLNRWLGFMQGVFWVLGIYTLDQLRNHNRP